MVDLMKNQRARTLLSILCVSGEYPCGSLSLIGPRRRIDKSVDKLTQKQKIFFSVSDPHPAPSPDAPSEPKKDGRNCDSICGTLLHRKGTIQSGTVRFTREGIKMMQSISPEECTYFKDANYYDGGYRNDQLHIDRNHRVAEATAMMAGAGIEFRPGLVQPLTLEPQLWTQPCYYPGKMLKSEAYGQWDTSTGSRHVGLLFTPSDVLIVYNTRGEMLKWSNSTEDRTRCILARAAGRNIEVKSFGSAVLIGRRKMVLPWLTKIYSTGHEKGSLQELYSHTYYCLLDSDEGEALLRIISQENWRERMLDFIFGRKERSSDEGIDGYRYDKPVVCLVDCDICRLAKLKSDPPTDGDYIILCSEEMEEPIREFIDSPKVEIRTISIADVAAKFE